MTVLGKLCAASKCIESMSLGGVPEQDEELFQDMHGASERLMAVGVLLADASVRQSNSPEIAAELARYRRNLQRLQAAISVVQERLSLKRAALILEREHLAAFAQWSTNLRQLQ